MTSERTKAMDDLIAQDVDLIEFMASDAACYLYPGEGQQAERAAYTRGCAHRIEAQAAEIERLREVLELIRDPDNVYYAGEMRAFARAALGEKQ